MPPAASGSLGRLSPLPYPALPAPSPHPELIGDRLGSIADLLRDPTSQQSVQERLSQTRVAVEALLAHPVFGLGPGTNIAWVDSSGRNQAGYYLDTPIMFEAKFGFLGFAVLAAWAGCAVASLRRLVHVAGWTPETLALFGYGTLFAAASFLGPPMDDKGASFALVFILALATGAASAVPSPRQVSIS